jgi:uncharacterized membrane protein
MRVILLLNNFFLLLLFFILSREFKRFEHKKTENRLLTHSKNIRLKWKTKTIHVLNKLISNNDRIKDI